MSDQPVQVTPAEIAEAVADLKRQLNAVAGGSTERIDCNPETVEQGLAKLVLGLIELIRRLLERQAIRRMEGGSLNDEQVENMGLALMKLEQKVHQLAGEFGLTPKDLNLDLGPLGKLLDE
ncbi:Gas vesicle K [Candidatus Koribacter versatilis Ellin345]|uniref:Gas vesicle K n=1 Tax=Koribacter versatilis (strain Ellin345) TaxID=204669 RepID=Q1INZ3_KORVE|nr:gas vesicle protein K [Candidatus Koribacter versatilis]ABF41407.1 Gas vesicle K [Candidatus Koribacter versatilis Ellin345]